jgi:hypothetical protein
MYKRTDNTITIYYKKGKDWFELLGKRVLYAKIVKVKKYDKMYGKFLGFYVHVVGFYVRVGGRYKQVHSGYGDKPYIR